jgi:hypothetical protein
MRLKEPSFLPLQIRGARGLAYQDEAYALRPAVFEVLGKVADGSVVLEAGRETRVNVSVPNLAANADVRSTRAVLEVLPTGTATTAPRSVQVQREGEQAQVFHVSGTGPAGPTNVTVRLDQGEPIWTHAGSLSSGEHQLPDFATQLNDYLDRADTGKQPVTISFLVTSDVRAEVRLQMQEVRFSQLQTQTWPNPLDDTIRLDRNLQLGFATVEHLVLDPIRDQPAPRRTVIRFDLAGDVGPERLLGPVRVHDGHELATVSVDYALAQAIEPSLALNAVGLVAFVRCDTAAELYAELAQASAASPELRQTLGTASLALEPTSDHQGRWAFLGLDPPVDLEPATTYWIVLRAVRGAVALALQSEPVEHLGNVLVNRGGQLWRNAGNGLSLNALVDLVYLPRPDNQTAAVEIGLEGAEPLRREDIGADVRTLTFAASALPASQPVTVVVRAHARGMLSVANVIQEYQR